MAFKFLGQRQLGKLPSRWVSTILMVAIRTAPKSTQKNKALAPASLPALQDADYSFFIVLPP